MAATWNYNGAGTLVITLDDAIAGYHYFASCSDSDSSPVSATASSSTLILTFTGIGGDTAGFQFAAAVQQGNASGIDTPYPFDCVAANVFTEGTASTSGTVGEVTWAYNGSTGLTATFTAVGGVTYLVQCGTDRTLGSETATGGPYTAGTSHTISLTLDTPVRASFEAYLFNNDTFTAYSDRIFAAGVADAGSPGNPASSPSPTLGRVFIAFDDGPLEPNPTWTCLDQGDPFPDAFVAGYEITTGRQSLISQTDTGEATVDINDHKLGLFDPRNVSSAYYGKLDGRQILLQLYDPVRAVWEPQFQGHIDNVLYDVDGSGVDQNGDPINVAIKLECVDIFDFLAGYGLTPGLDGVTPRVVPSGSAGGAVPAGFEDGVYYAETVGSVDDRIIEILADVGIDSTRYHVSSGSVRVIAVKYDPDESALVALRDACDAEFPFIANMYVDRRGRFTFRGRGARFDPDGVSSEPGSTWDFTRWAVGDGNAIIADPTRAQMRVLSYGRGRRDIINAAISYPQGISATDMPGQVFADTTSITAYGKHQAQPLSDLLTLNGTVTGNNANQETALYAELLVKNQKDPRESIASLQLKAIRPDDPRGAATWALITQADISHIVNCAVGYPGGTGFTGASPADDYYIEGRHLQVTVANTSHDYVELNLEVSPAIWSMDTHSVFPPFPDSGAPTVLTADFTAPGIG